MRACRSLVGAVVVALGCASVAAGAQGDLPAQLVASPVITPDQRQQIDTHVQTCIQQMTREDAPVVDIAAARKSLAGPIREPSASATFKEAYAIAVGEALKTALDANQQLVVRLNAIIMTANMVEGLNDLPAPEILGNAGVVDLIVLGLKDNKPEVRYWAAKAVTLRRDFKNVAVADQQRLLQALLQMAQQEVWMPAFLKALEAMGLLIVNEANAGVLQILDARVNLLAAHPDQPLVGEQGGLRAVYRRLVIAVAPDQQAAQIKRELTRIAFRYALLSTKVLNAGAAPKNKASYVDMLTLVDIILFWAQPNCIRQQGVIGGLVQDEEWDVLLLQLNALFTCLVNQANFAPKGLEVPDVNVAEDDDAD